MFIPDILGSEADSARLENVEPNYIARRSAYSAL